jgi:hypothetical protein
VSVFETFQKKSAKIISVSLPYFPPTEYLNPTTRHEDDRSNDETRTRTKAAENDSKTTNDKETGHKPNQKGHTPTNNQ